jgi:hypothetical protein
MMDKGQPRFATKDELWAVAKREMGISRASFDVGWNLAIFDTGREDWWEPLRGRRRVRN